jgi:hypothetical protein
MSIYISAARSLNQTNFDQCAEFRSDGSRAVVIDLTRCMFIDHYGIVAMLTIIHRLTAPGQASLGQSADAYCALATR